MKSTAWILSMTLLVLAACGGDDGDRATLDSSVARDATVGDAGMDATSPALDAGLEDASKPQLDGTSPTADEPLVIGYDGAVLLDRDASGQQIDNQENLFLAFCEDEYAHALDWSSLVLHCQTCFSESVPSANALLRSAFFYETATVRYDSAYGCHYIILGGVGTKYRFDGRYAKACTERWTSQFPAAPAQCPASPIDAEMIAATYGHQALPVVQLPECRQTVIGLVGPNGDCFDSMACQSGLRCLGVTTSSEAPATAGHCADALPAGHDCVASEDCEDGLLCVGVAGVSGGRVCRAASAPVEETAACQATTECRVGLVCVESRCTKPTLAPACQ